MIRAMVRRWWWRWVVGVVARRGPLSKRELLEALAGAHDGGAQELQLRAVLHVCVAQEVVAAENLRGQKMNAEERAFWAGWMTGAWEIQQMLEGLVGEAETAKR
jgi:hypothetical protein